MGSDPFLRIAHVVEIFPVTRLPFTIHCRQLFAHCSLLIAHTSLLTPHCSHLTAHTSTPRLRNTFRFAEPRLPARSSAYNGGFADWALLARAVGTSRVGPFCRRRPRVDSATSSSRRPHNKKARRKCERTDDADRPPSAAVPAPRLPPRRLGAWVCPACPACLAWSARRPPDASPA